MKKIAFFLVFFLGVYAVQAQDIIFKTSGDQLPAKVTEVKESTIFYTLSDSAQGPVLSLPKTEVFMIQYANGTTELIKIEIPLDTLGLPVKSAAEFSRDGRRDARLLYKGKGVFWGSAAAGAMSWFTGGATLAIPVAMAVTPPSSRTLRVADPRLAQNRDYMQGYRKQAHWRKVGKAAAGTGTGILASAALVVAVVLIVFL
ncbi:hypothetical protein AHMF7605_07840 [Adhaeribacter arboris]|uniref:Uncharacterized protein n=1 Tax=Adhaeribacter arboris TaxID=2072846 RepID=A0A2T2YD40_9BACT|nr:hypothetical protein [Adhaeribacter arboris]PSR53441.1 hypothetical protein AHMF7605_07840 [Adhaeribacter arboris]